MKININPQKRKIIKENLSKKLKSKQIYSIPLKNIENSLETKITTSNTKNEKILFINNNNNIINNNNSNNNNSNNNNNNINEINNYIANEEKKQKSKSRSKSMNTTLNKLIPLVSETENKTNIYNNNNMYKSLRNKLKNKNITPIKLRKFSKYNLINNINSKNQS